MEGSGDRAYNGFCRTERHHRLHYKIARYRDYQAQEIADIQAIEDVEKELLAAANEEKFQQHKKTILRMKDLKLEDYYSAADKVKDAKCIALFFDKSRKYKVHLDGSRMINQFVKPNVMT